MLRRKVLSLQVGASTEIAIIEGLQRNGFSAIQPLSGGSTASVYRAQKAIDGRPTSVIIKGALTSNTATNGHPHIIGEFEHLRSHSGALSSCMAQVLSPKIESLPLDADTFDYFMMEDCGDSLSTLMKARALEPSDFNHAIRTFIDTFVKHGLLSQPVTLLTDTEQSDRWQTYYMDRLNSRVHRILKHHPDLTELFETPTFTIKQNGRVQTVPNLLHLIQTYPGTFQTLFQPHALFPAVHRELNTGNIAYKDGVFKAFDPHSGSAVQETYDFGKLLFGFTFCDVIAENLVAEQHDKGAFTLRYKREQPISDPRLKLEYKTTLAAAPELDYIRFIEPNFHNRMYFIESFQLLCDIGYRVGDKNAILTRLAVASHLFSESPVSAHIQAALHRPSCLLAFV
jgi:hypothetical protein